MKTTADLIGTMVFQGWWNSSGASILPTLFMGGATYGASWAGTTSTTLNVKIQNVNTAFTVPNPQDDKPHTIAFQFARATDTVRSVWMDGVYYGEQTAAGSGWSLPATLEFMVSQSSDSRADRIMPGSYHLGFYTEELLPLEFVRDLTVNPWQLFQPLNRRLYFGAAAATGLPTLSAATVTNIQSTSATPRVTVTY